MKKMFLGACIALAALAHWAGALEISDLQFPLFRADADAKLGKNYTFQILQDGSIRRIWNLRGKTVTVDFDSGNNQAICVIISYDKPVARKVALEDCRLLSGDKTPEKAHWSKTKPEAMEKVGMSHAHVLKLTDSSYLFREDEGKNKTTRVTLYAQAPKNNRLAIPAIQGDGRTALGNSGQHGNIQELIRDETQRQNSTAAPLASNGPAPTATREAGVPGRSTIPSLRPAAPSTGRSPGMGNPKPDELASTAPARSQAETAQGATPAAPGAATPGSPAPATEAKPQPANLLEALGLDNPSPVQYCLGGIILLILLMLIGGGISSARRKARARANFQAVSAARPLVKKGTKRPVVPVKKKH